MYIYRYVLCLYVCMYACRYDAPSSHCSVRTHVAQQVSYICDATSSAQRHIYTTIDLVLSMTMYVYDYVCK